MSVFCEPGRSGRAMLLRNDTPRSIRGFTLIELLTVLAVSLIMLVVGVPSFAAYLADQRVSAASRDVMQDLISARTESARTGLRARLVPKTDADWGSGWEIVRNVDTLGDDSNVVQIDDAPLTADRVELSVCEAAAGVAPRIEFDAMGELLVPMDGVRITLIATVAGISSAREVLIAPSGRAETHRVALDDAALACG